MREVLMDKAFIREYEGGAIVPLTISYRPCDLDRKATRETEEISGEFVTVSICNVPEGIRGFETSYVDESDKFGQWSGTSLNVREARGVVKELLGKRKELTSLEADRFVEAMTDKDSFNIRHKNRLDENEEQEEGADGNGNGHQHEGGQMQAEVRVGTVTVQVSNPRDVFYILADGNIVGPLKKITVGSSTLLHGEDGEVKDFKLPVQSFFANSAFAQE